MNSAASSNLSNGRIITIFLGIWIIFFTFVAQGANWAAPIISPTTDIITALLQTTLWPAVLIGLPLLALSVYWQEPRYRSVYRTWLKAVAYPLFLAPTRLLIPTAGQMLLLSQSLLTALFIVLLWWLTREKWLQMRPTSSSRLLAIAATAVVAMPWLLYGALGSALDIILGLMAGLLFGITAAVVISRFWLHILSKESRGIGADSLAGGFVCGITLLLMSSGLSFNGVQLLLMCVLPALGWIVMSVAIMGNQDTPVHNWRAVGLLVGGTAVAILLFTDSDGLYLGAFDEILRWSWQAAFISVLLAWLLGFLTLVFRHKLAAGLPARPLAGTAVALWSIALLLYFIGGQSGLYGDRLFVVLKEQADISQASAITDINQRRETVYKTAVAHADQSQANLRQTLQLWGITYTPYYLVNGLEVQGGLLHRLWLSAHPDVDRVIASPTLRPTKGDLTLPNFASDAPTEPAWNLTNIGADRVWSEFGVSGEGIVIGQSDSGVQGDHPQLAERYRGQNGQHNGNWLDPWNHSAEPIDNTGHGTHTLGTILGQKVGVAPDAIWFACANLQRSLANPALYLDCMQFMLAPYPQGGDPFTDGDPAHAAHIVNNSWSCPYNTEGCDPQSLRPAIQALRAAGIFVVVSAGNDGPLCGSISDPPAIYDEAFVVGAVDRHNEIAEFSSTGPVTVDGNNRIKPDIAAPGVDVISTVPTNSFASNSGTSMAGPHVVGVVALMWSANPDLIGDIERTEQILAASATPFQQKLSDSVNNQLAAEATAVNTPCLAQTDTSIVPNNIVGFGIVNAYDAVKMALNE